MGGSQLLKEGTEAKEEGAETSFGWNEAKANWNCTVQDFFLFEAGFTV